MKKTIIGLFALAMMVAGCGGNETAVVQSDSTEYAVYDGIPVGYEEDLEPVYIPLELLGMHQPGDTCVTDSNGMLVPVLMRDAESKQPVMFDGYHKVRLDVRLFNNRKFKNR